MLLLYSTYICINFCDCNSSVKQRKEKFRRAAEEEAVGVTDWYRLGEGLKLPKSTLEEIGDIYKGDGIGARSKVLEEWIKFDKIATVQKLLLVIRKIDSK